MAVSTRRTPADSVTALPSPARLPRSQTSSTVVIRWQRATTGTEKRQWPRRSLRCALVLNSSVVEPQAKLVTVPAECSDISNGGLCAIVPLGYGVAIGQRYTFQLTIGERGPEPGSLQTVSQQGEIVRAELLLGEDGYADRVGIGVRLFGPRSGLVPMPVTA